MVFSKRADLVGGLTLMPEYEKQSQNHLDVSVKHMSGFITMPKS